MGRVHYKAVQRESSDLTSDVSEVSCGFWFCKLVDNSTVAWSLL